MALPAVPSFARVCVIGGGAAGFYSAIACAEAAGFGALAHGAAARRGAPAILVLEQSADVLGKVRLSGGGRCNVTHSAGGPAANHYPRGARLVDALAGRHGAPDTRRWFEGRGVELKTEPDGRVFPASDSSECIVSCLRGAAEELGVAVRTGQRVVAGATISDAGPGRGLGRFRLSVRDAASGGTADVECDRVILCCGSAQKRSVQGLVAGCDPGVSMLPPVPSLFSLMFADPASDGIVGLEGVSAIDAQLELVQPVAQDDAAAEGDGAGSGGGSESTGERWRRPPPQRGPVLFTHDGISGPGMLRLSAWGAYPLHASGYSGVLRVSWAPFVEDFDALVAAIRAVPGGIEGERPPIRKRPIGEKSPWPRVVPARLWRRLVERAAATPPGEVLVRGRWAARPLVDQLWQRFERHEDAVKLARALQGPLWRDEIAVRGRRVNKAEFVTAGGVDWSAGGVDLERMESTTTPGVHFAGELLDVDGVTGGYNFQGCWSTGYVAGRAAAESLLADP